jgi:hypothetical protein
MKWRHKINIKHLLTEKEDHKSVQASMNAIADVLDKDHVIQDLGFNTQPFRNIPQGDEYFGPVDYANNMLGRLYDLADVHRIWIG